MNKKITSIGLLFLIVLIGGKELHQQPELQPAEATPSDMMKIDNPLQPASAEAVKSKSEAQALAAAESQGAEVVETNAEDSTEPGKLNQSRNHGTAEFADKVVRVWDDNYQLWRDVRVGDYEWTRGADGVFSIGETKPKWSIRTGDQYAEAVLSRYSKSRLGGNPKGMELGRTLGGNPESMERGRTYWIVVISWLVMSFIWNAICLKRIAKKSRTEPSWLAWVPIGQLYLTFKLARTSGWYMPFVCVPYIGFLYLMAVWTRVPKCLGIVGAQRFLIIVPLVSNIYMGWLAFRQEPQSVPNSAN
jgi:hypothetical protein